MQRPAFLGERIRAQLIERLRRRLLKKDSARSELRLILLLTAVIGFAASATMLHLGLGKMSVRYPLAALIGWLGFLALVRLWAEVERRRLESARELDDIAANAAPESLPETGGSASGGFDWLWDWFGFFGETEGCLVAVFLWVLLVLLLVAFGSVVLALGGLIGNAEALLAEVVLDTVLVAALYRRLLHLEPRWWLGGAMRHTLKPTLLTVAFLAGFGLLLDQLAPNAHSIGKVWREIHAPAQPR